jgi:DNA-binding response OmpR family regulator
MVGPGAATGRGEAQNRRNQCTTGLFADGRRSVRIALEKGRILLVEDEPIVLELLGLALRSEGYEVDPATTVAEAMERLDQMRYALVATDWRLPDGDGGRIADHAADLGAKTIIFSGFLFSIPMEVTKRHELLMKPMRPSEFVSAVERCLSEASGA